MAITRLEFPAASSPNVNTDYNLQNVLIGAIIKQGIDGFKLTGWNNINELPAIKQGAYIRHNGYVYVVDSADYAIQGTLAVPNPNFVILAGTGSTITATWSTSISGYTYDPIKNGLYNGTNQAMREFCRILSGTTFINGYLRPDGKSLWYQSA